MDTPPAAAPPAPLAHRIETALVGAALGASLAQPTEGRPRGVTPRRRAFTSGARTDRVGEVARVLSGAEAAEDDPWFVSALRHGLARRCDPMAEFVADLGISDRPRLEASAMAAVAAAVSAAVDGCRPDVVTSLAVMAADTARSSAQDEPGPDLGARLHWACALATRTEDDPGEVLDLLVGTGPVVQECVPAAFALFAAQVGAGVGGRVDADSGATTGDRPCPADIDGLEACVAAAELGGAATVIATVVGALVGASWPEAFPEDVADDTKGSWPALASLGESLATSRRLV